MRHSYALFSKCREDLTDETRFKRLSFSCLKLLCDTFYVVHIAVNWWRKLDFERLQCMNKLAHRLVGLHHIEVFAFYPVRVTDFNKPSKMHGHIARLFVPCVFCHCSCLSI